MQCDLLNSCVDTFFFFLFNSFGCCRVEYLVLDESDKLFEPGLFTQIDSIIKACTNPSIIRSLFSATLPDFVEDRARELMHDAVRVIVGRK
jgi:ATP-dependent RNA helicase DDX52/ROK1